MPKRSPFLRCFCIIHDKHANDNTAVLVAWHNSDCVQFSIAHKTHASDIAAVLVVVSWYQL
jgi:hypothetical protein